MAACQTSDREVAGWISGHSTDK